MFEQSENVAIAHLEPEQLLAVRGVASAIIAYRFKVHSTSIWACAVLMGNLAQAGYGLCILYRLHLYGL